MHLFLIRRWTTSGVLDCSFEQYKFKYYNECDDGIPLYFYYDLPYSEKADLNLFIELSKKSETIVDIGANTGLFSVLASVVNPKSTIHAVEPYGINAERMSVNLGLNAAKNVTVHEIALGEEEGTIQLAIPDNKSITDVSSVNGTFSQSIYPDIVWSSQTVTIKSLDQFVRENKLRIDLMKCDVETFEMAVFKGAKGVLETDKPTIIFECFLDEERKLFFNNILTTYNYYVYLILEQGVVYMQEGFADASFGLNYLITPVKPSQTFISYKNVEDLWKNLLLRPATHLQ